MRLIDRTIASLAVLASLSAPAVVWAQPAKPAKVQVSQDDLARAKELFDAGAREYEAGRFEGAIQAFQQAFKIAPRDGIMFSMAQAHRRQFTRTNEKKHLLRSVALYKEYVDRVKSGGRVADAVKALGELAPLVATLGAETAEPEPTETLKTRIVVNVVVPGTKVSIDGGPPKDAPVNEEVVPGPHKVTLTAPGYFDEEREIRVGEGEIAPANLPQRERPAQLALDVEDRAEISVDGRFVGETPLARPIELPSGKHFVAVTKNGHETFQSEITLERAAGKKIEIDLKATTQRDASYVVLVSAGVLGIATGVFGALAIERESVASNLLLEREKRPLTRAELDEYDHARSRRTLYTQLTFGLGGGGAALLILGTGLLVFDKPDPVIAPSLERRQTPTPRDGTDTDVDITPSISLSPGFLGGGVSGTF
ncbi:MAG: PEGA domain-containing protein [Polyangiaceae bacterium]|nr:PEGA domain-containing protein [Polyangiaceae bacterium]